MLFVKRLDYNWDIVTAPQVFDKLVVSGKLISIVCVMVTPNASSKLYAPPGPFVPEVELRLVQNDNCVPLSLLEPCRPLVAY